MLAMGVANILFLLASALAFPAPATNLTLPDLPGSVSTSASSSIQQNETYLHLPLTTSPPHTSPWPTGPLTYHLRWDIDVTISRCTPIASSPAEKEAVRNGIRAIIKTFPTAHRFPAGVQHYRIAKGPVVFEFRPAGTQPTPRRFLTAVLESLLQLMRKYGPASLSASIDAESSSVGHFYVYIAVDA